MTEEGTHGPSRVGRFRTLLDEWAEVLTLVRQLDLMDEGSFVRFARERGVPVQGVITGDPGVLHSKGWLTSDGMDDLGRLLFHPFRLLPLAAVLREARHDIKLSWDMEPDHLARLGALWLDGVRDGTRIEASARYWNEAADLLTLLEPLYWPQIVGHARIRDEQQRYEEQVKAYGTAALSIVGSLDESEWRACHERIRVDAGWADDNSALYLLLRLSKWRQREGLRGQIAKALWLRHMAEVLRRGFEHLFETNWPEEDQAFGWWAPGGREFAFGFERPLDNEQRAASAVVTGFGLYTGSVVRWYVEGETEYSAVEYLLPRAREAGIELMNLRGNLVTGKANIALKLRDALQEDRSLLRLSFISFDMDVGENVKAIRRNVEEGRVVGHVFAHDPDFEFENFALEELVEIAAELDEAKGVSASPIRQARWTDVTTGRQFEDRYSEVSARGPCKLKGSEWGEVLADYAWRHPEREARGTERPFIRAIRAALNAPMARYHYFARRFEIDPESFELRERPDPADT